MIFATKIANLASRSGSGAANSGASGARRQQTTAGKAFVHVSIWQTFARTRQGNAIPVALFLNSRDFFQPDKKGFPLELPSWQLTS